MKNMKHFSRNLGKINADEFASTKKIMKMEKSSKKRCEELFNLAADVMKEYQVKIYTTFFLKK